MAVIAKHRATGDSSVRSRSTRETSVRLGSWRQGKWQRPAFRLEPGLIAVYGGDAGPVVRGGPGEGERDTKGTHARWRSQQAPRRGGGRLSPAGLGAPVCAPGAPVPTPKSEEVPVARGDDDDQHRDSSQVGGHGARGQPLLCPHQGATTGAMLHPAWNRGMIDRRPGARRPLRARSWLRPRPFSKPKTKRPDDQHRQPDQVAPCHRASPPPVARR